MITAALTAVVVWCMLYGRVSVMVLLPVCLGLSLAIALSGRHRHTQFLSIDVLAQTSRLNAVNAPLKFWASLALMLLCISARSPFAGLFLMAAMPMLTVFAGGLSLREYIRLLTLPVSFLMLGGLVLLFEISAQPGGALSVPMLGVWLTVSEQAQFSAMLVMARSVGAASCLYLLSLTTPMPELIGVLRRARCPGVVIELMYLIYRYIFILLSMFHTMQSAAKSRLGYANYHAAMRTTGNIYASLLVRSYRQAGANFDAMESRCYDMEIRFLESGKAVRGMHAAAVVLMIGITFVLRG